MLNVLSYRALTLSVLVWLGSPFLRAEEPKEPPDLTHTQDVNRDKTYNLGATGLRGWIFTRPENFFESQQGRTTTKSRQILITHVGARSPADGVIQVNDVILGTGGKPFTRDARQSIALAIQEAEKADNQGRFQLTRWRAGTTEEVQLTLNVLGTYSAKAPYNCPKSKAIYDAACLVLAREPLKDDIWGCVNGLALLSTGNPEYLPRVREFARKIAPKDLKLPLKDGMVIWDWGYRGLFLCEYFLITHDKDVLPAIHEYTTKLALGQSLYGTFGHGIARLTPSGQRHGSIPPYGPVNAAGLIGNLAIVMGKKCGVNDAEIPSAIDRASKFFGYFVEKGAIPYGEHLPWPNHENNGKNAMAAVFFTAQGDKVPESQFFARMVTASYQNREYGHTGQGFSYLWGALGANTGGPEALAGFFTNASWHFDLVRRCDGSFTYDGDEQFGAGKTDDNTYYGASGYYGLSPTACYVLTYAIPLKKLVITGREANPKHWLSTEDVAAALRSGRLDLDRTTMSNDQLLSALTDWSPVARGWVAEELGKRPERHALVPVLIKLAEGSDVRQRQGAAEALGYMRDARALPVLVKLLTADDRWLRVKAAHALRELGDVAKPVVPAMLKVVVDTAEPTLPVVWEDPIQLTQGELAAALFQGLLNQSVKEVDPALLYPAIRAVANNPDGMARSYLTHTIIDLLTLEDVQALAPDLLEAIHTPSPADTMFANEIRMASLKALAKYRFKEGIAVSLQFASSQSAHGSESRTGEIMKQLLSYGKAAKVTLPGLKKLIVQFEHEEDFPDWAKKQKIDSVKEAIRALEKTTAVPQLRTIGAAAKPKKKSALLADQRGKSPVKVFILAGQSNMQGQGVTGIREEFKNSKGTLTSMLADPVKAPLIKHLRNAKGEWVERKDVWVYDINEFGTRKGNLDFGFGWNLGDKTWFGPELQFGHVVKSQIPNQVLIIKTAWGGRALYTDFRPPSSGGAVGPFYQEMIQTVKRVLANLQEEFPDYDGAGYELAGFVWWHGWNDFCDPTNAVPEYEHNLVNLIHDVRKDLNAPGLPVVVGEFTGPWGADCQEPAALAVRKAQAAAAAREEFHGNVNFVETHDYVRTEEDSPTGEGYHEFKNGETYFLIGDAFGKSMLKLLKK